VVGEPAASLERLDRRLPGLARAFDGEALADAFAALLGVPPAAVRCTRRATRYQPGIRLAAAYELAVHDAERDGRRTSFGAVTVQPATIVHRLFQDDPSLPGLPLAADRDAVTRRLATESRLGDVSAVTPVRYTPERRCVLRYDPGANGRTVLYAKAFAAGAEAAAATLAGLHGEAAEGDGFPRVPAPVACWSDLELLVQRAVPGRQLGDVAFAPDLAPGHGRELMVSAGVAIGALHAAGAVPGQRRTLADDLRELADYVELVGRFAPDLAGPYRGLVARLADAAALAEPAPVASHGALRTDQLVLGEDVALVDLDGYCWANPARDVGNLLAYLDWRAIRRPDGAERIERNGAAFARGYAERGPRLGDEWLTAYRAASLLKIAGRRFRTLSFDEWPRVPALVERAGRLLGG
jgi:hypothetical protein